MSNKKQNRPTAAGPSQAKKAPAGNTQARSATRREQLRAQQAAEAKRAQQRRVLTVVGIVLAVAIVITVGVIVYQQWSKNRQDLAQDQQATDAQIVPGIANKDGNALVAFNSAANTSLPLVTIFEDPQCPGCAQASKTIDPVFESLAKKGQIQLQYHVLYGLDSMFPGQNSYRGSIAFSCAADVDKFETYSKVVYAGQPAKEGAGWNDDQLRNTFAQAAGITGDDLTKFQGCFDSKATNDFVKKMQSSKPSYVVATPSFAVGDKLMDLQNSDVASEEALMAAINRTK